MGRTSVVSSSRRSVSAPTFAASGSARRCKAFSRRRGRPPAQKPSNNNGDYYNNNNNNKDKNNNNEIKKKKKPPGLSVAPRLRSRCFRRGGEFFPTSNRSFSLFHFSVIYPPPKKLKLLPFAC